MPNAKIKFFFSFWINCQVKENETQLLVIPEEILSEFSLLYIHVFELPGVFSEGLFSFKRAFQKIVSGDFKLFTPLIMERMDFRDEYKCHLTYSSVRLLIGWLTHFIVADF